MNALKHHWYETSLLRISSCFEEHGVQRFHHQEICARDWFCILPRMKESMAIVPYQSFHVMLHYFKKKTSTCGSQVGHMWVTSGLFCRSVGHMGQQIQPTFNPA